MKTGILLSLVTAALLGVASSASAETVVIASASSRVRELSRDEVLNIYMGRYRKLKDGSSVVPIEPGIETATRRTFYMELLGKSVSDIRAYWARLVFSGRTSPPEEVATDAEVVDRVARDPLSVGYVDRQAVTSRVRVVYVLSP